MFYGTGVGSGRAGGGACAPPPLLRVGGGGKDMFVPPHFQTKNLGLGIEPTDMCDVPLAWLASRCWARQMCPPPHTHTFCHVPTPLYGCYPSWYKSLPCRRTGLPGQLKGIATWFPLTGLDSIVKFSLTWPPFTDSMALDAYHIDSVNTCYD